MIKKLLDHKNNKDITYLLKQGKFKVVLVTSIILIGFILSWYLANKTSIEFYGNYVFIISVLGMVGIFSFSGFKDAITRSIAKGNDYSLVFGTKKQFLLSISGSIVFMILAVVTYFLNDNHTRGIIYIICALFFPLYTTLDNFKSYLNAKLKFKTELVSEIIVSLLKVGSIITTILIFGENLIALFITFFLSQVIPYSFFFITFKSQAKKGKADKGLVGYAIFLTGLKLIFQITTKINNIIIGVFVGPATLAHYFIGTSLVSRVSEFIKPLISVLYPKLSNGSFKVTKKKLIVIFLASILLILPVILILPLFIKFLFPKYIDSVNYGLIFSLTLLFQPTIAILQFYFRALKKKDMMKKITLVENISRLVMIVPLFIFFEIYGLIFSVILANFIGASIRVYYFLRMNP